MEGTTNSEICETCSPTCIVQQYTHNSSFLLWL